MDNRARKHQKTQRDYRAARVQESLRAARAARTAQEASLSSTLALRPADTSAVHVASSTSSAGPSATHADASTTSANPSATQAGSSAVTARISAQWAFSTGPSVSTVPLYANFTPTPASHTAGTASATPTPASHTAATASATLIHTASTASTASATLPCPSGPIPFPNISPSDPLYPRYSTNEYVDGAPRRYVHNQAVGSRITMQTNAAGLAAFSKKIKHYAAHMHKQNYALAPHSAPYKSGTTARSFQVAWSPGQHAIRTRTRLRASTVNQRGTASTQHDAISPNTKLQLLPRSKAADDAILDALAPEGKVYVYPEPTCHQHFHSTITKGAVLEHLLCHAHTDFSYHKNENEHLREQRNMCSFLENKAINTVASSKDDNLSLLALNRPAEKRRALFIYRHSLKPNFKTHIASSNSDPHAEETIDIAEDLFTKGILDQATELVTVCGFDEKPEDTNLLRQC